MASFNRVILVGNLTRDVDLHIIGQALILTPPEYALFLNVDLSSFNDKEFVQKLRGLLGPACAGGRSITIEITERETIPLSESLHQDIKGLRALGCKLALDDFGSSFGMKTIAECVENAETEKALQDIGIINAQGLFYGAPRLSS